MPSLNAKKLRIAAGRGDVKTIRELIAGGVNVDATTNGETALHAAATFGKDRAAVELVKVGANIDALDSDGCTPLMVACTKGLSKGSKVALTLIELGADVKYARGDDGASALRFAVTRASPDVLKALVAHGAKVDGRRGDAITPLMKAAVANRLEAVKVLVEAGASLTRKCTLPWAKGKTAYAMAVQTSSKAVATYLTEAEATPERSKQTTLGE